MLLAKGIQKVTGIPIGKDHLIRTKTNVSQTKFSKYDRWNNVRAIFDLVDQNGLNDKHILLVDDVLTTGATIEACTAAILSKVNCKISVATLAVRV